MYPTDLDITQWEIIKTKKGLYTMSTKGSPTGHWPQFPGGPHVFAFLQSPFMGVSPVDWKITEVETTEGQTGHMYVVPFVDDTDALYSLRFGYAMCSVSRPNFPTV